MPKGVTLQSALFKKKEKDTQYLGKGQRSSPIEDVQLNVLPGKSHISDAGQSESCDVGIDYGPTVVEIDHNLIKSKSAMCGSSTEYESDAPKANSLKTDVQKKNEGIQKPKWSFVGVVNAAFKSSDDKRKASTMEFELSPSHTHPETASLTSIASYYMERDFRYYFQHPFIRLAVAYLVTFCNFLIYAEDPIAHSEKECFIPVVGNCFSFVFTKYPSNGWSLLKVLLWIAAILCGTIVGKLIIHKLVFNKLFRLRMFAKDHGSWMIMFFTTIMFLFIFSWLYNSLLLIGGDSTIDFRISELMGIKNSLFMKAAATGTWCGDFFTAWMVTDIMLQETKLYPDWARPIRKWWNRSYHRIILFWFVVVVTSVVVITLIATNLIKWDKLNRDFVPSNEMSRAFLASFILVMDLLIVMQDWDFPYFVNNFDVKLPGLNTAKLTFHIPKCLKREKWIVHITGKWFNYGIIFIVMILDLNMWKNQIFYKPYEYGQYTGPEGKIYTVLDKESLEFHNQTFVSYEWRSNNTNLATNKTYVEGDMIMNSQYHHYPLRLKGIAFVPSLAAFVIFGLFIWFFGRWHPSPTDPYSGRLKKKYKPKPVTRWGKLRAFFYAKSKFDARLQSFRKHRTPQIGDNSVNGKNIPSVIEKGQSESLDNYENYDTGENGKKIMCSMSDNVMDEEEIENDVLKSTSIPGS